ncbi:MAG: AAA family ATPase [Simkaniaceae bacterium]|nr:MAG: AAA family ATPase [Simkaniaceae bacterium]
METVLNCPYAGVGRWAMAVASIKGVEALTNNPKMGVFAIPFYFFALHAFIKPLSKSNPEFAPMLAANLTLLGTGAFFLEGAVQFTSKEALEKSAFFKLVHSSNEMVALATYVVVVVAAIFTIDSNVRVQCILATSILSLGYAKKFYQETSYFKEVNQKKLFNDIPPYYLTDETAELSEKKVKYLGRADLLGKFLVILSLKIPTNNPCLVGTPGSGKTELIRFFASEINQGRVPEFEGWKVYSTNSKMLLENTKYVGELQSKVNDMFRFLKGKKAIVFIDEIHQALSDGKTMSSPDASLAEALLIHMTDPDIRIVAATTSDHYNKLRGNEPFRQRFEQLRMPRMTDGLKKEILQMHLGEIQAKFPELQLGEGFFEKIQEVNKLKGERGLRRDISLLHIVAERMARSGSTADEVLKEELNDYIEGYLDTFDQVGCEISDGFRGKLSAESKRRGLGFFGENILFLRVVAIVSDRGYRGTMNLDLILDQLPQEL